MWRDKKKKRIWRRKNFFLPPSSRLTSREPWSHRQCQRNCTANHTKDSSSLFALFQVVFKKHRPFWMFSQICTRQTQATRYFAGNTQMSLDLVLREWDWVSALRLLSSRSFWGGTIKENRATFKVLWESYWFIPVSKRIVVELMTNIFLWHLKCVHFEMFLSHRFIFVNAIKLTKFTVLKASYYMINKALQYYWLVKVYNKVN